MSSSNAVNEAKAALEAEKLLVELRMLGSFDFGDRDSGVAHEAGAGNLLSTCSTLSVCSGICGGGCR